MSFTVFSYSTTVLLIQPNPSHVLENATQPNPLMDPTHVHLWYIHSTKSRGDSGVSCFVHDSGEAAVTFVDWNAILGNDGNAFLSRRWNLSQFAFRQFHRFLPVWLEVWDLRAPGLVDVGYMGSRLALDIQLGEGRLQNMTPNRGLARNVVPNIRCLSALGHTQERGRYMMPILVACHCRCWECHISSLDGHCWSLPCDWVLPGLTWWFVDIGNVIASCLHHITVAGR